VENGENPAVKDPKSATLNLLMAYSLGRFLTLSALLLFCVAAFGCATAVVKPEAFDTAILKRTPLPSGLITQEKKGEYLVTPGTGWMGGLNSTKNLTFAGFRPDSQSLLFCLVIHCDPVNDQLVLLPLDDGETPLTVLTDQKRREELKQIVSSFNGDPGEYLGKRALISLPLSQAITQKKLGLPLPKPGRIFAVAANFPSHLKYDLAIKDPAVPKRLGKTRARVFLKYPPVMPPDTAEAHLKEFTGIIGPYDGVDYPSHITLPAVDGIKEETETRLDYEVEIGVVIKRRLTWDIIESGGEDAIRPAIAGYLLVSDTKARNPQVVERLLTRNLPYPKEPSPYLTGDEDIDRALGLWNSETCVWWGYAASWGNYASLGPFFVSAPPDWSFPARALISARSYGAFSKRPFKPPQGRDDEVLYLRQCSIITEEDGHQDKLIWEIPRIISSILGPDSALTFREGTPALEPGDIICLGTPGGTVITAQSRQRVNLLRKVLFWWNPMDWHDVFFDKNTELYLHDGDKVFFWAEGLGFQHQEIRRISIE
jgi:2-keto-4-pentenoate hydratase/2-oxohepta-3-ene-1,7-dioic acid hydratase in catechol pathway